MSEPEMKTTTDNRELVAIKPTPVWTPLPIQGVTPPPYYTPRFGYQVIPLHPTFACELKGVDWSKPITPDQYAEIREVSDKVSARGKLIMILD